jgi:hypothetical protein
MEEAPTPFADGLLGESHTERNLAPGHAVASQQDHLSALTITVSGGLSSHPSFQLITL